MKKFKLTKIIASTLIASSILALNPIGASAEWKQDSTGWWYADRDSYYTGWKQIDGNWYYFNNNGYMAHDRNINGYRLDSSGAWTTSKVTVEEALNIIKAHLDYNDTRMNVGMFKEEISKDGEEYKVGGSNIYDVTESDEDLYHFDTGIPQYFVGVNSGIVYTSAHGSGVGTFECLDNGKEWSWSVKTNSPLSLDN